MAHLNTADYLVFLAAAIVAIIGGSVGHVLSITTEAEIYTRFMVAGAILVSLFFVYQARSAWDGELARYLEVIGVGFAILMLTWIPHIGWHLNGEPTHFGLSGGFWIGMFHTLTAVTFLVVGYGFYLFWQEG